MAIKTHTYSWSGINDEQAVVKGEIEAQSIKDARRQLHRASITIKQLKKNRPVHGLSKRAISPKQACVFSRQLATMVSAGLPISECLRSIATTSSDPSISMFSDEIATEIEKGASLNQALSNQERFSDPLFKNLVAAGEESGTLDVMLQSIATHYEKTLTLKKKVSSAVLYPALILICSILVTSLLLIFIVPQFKQVFSNTNTSLPSLTQFILDCSELLRLHASSILICVLTLVLIITVAKRTSPKAKFLVNLLVLKIPVIGRILLKSAFARFARTLSILFAAGVSLIKAIELSSKTMNNYALQKPMTSVLSDIESGISVEQALRSSKVFPNLMLQMVASGEQSGRLDFMLDKVADLYENEVFVAVENLGNILEPILIMILGSIIATVVISMYLPIFKLASLF